MARYDGIATWYDTEFLGAFTNARLRLERFDELCEADYPFLVALRARK